MVAIQGSKPMLCFDMEMQWLSKALKMKVKKHFEEKYKKRLSEKEIIDIAENLTGYMETIIKFKINYENEKK